MLVLVGKSFNAPRKQEVKHIAKHLSSIVAINVLPNDIYYSQCTCASAVIYFRSFIYLDVFLGCLCYEFKSLVL